jgi:hypothetical protein
VVEDFDDPADRKFLPGGYTIKNDAVIHSYSRPDMRGGGRDLSDTSRHEVDPERDWAGRLREDEDPPVISSTITDPLTREEFDELLADKKLLDEAREARLVPPYTDLFVQKPDGTFETSFGLFDKVSVGSEAEAVRVDAEQTVIESWSDASRFLRDNRVDVHDYMTVRASEVNPDIPISAFDDKNYVKFKGTYVTDTGITRSNVEVVLSHEDKAEYDRLVKTAEDAKRTLDTIAGGAVLGGQGGPISPGRLFGDIFDLSGAVQGERAEELEDRPKRDSSATSRLLTEEELRAQEKYWEEQSKTKDDTHSHDVSETLDETTAGAVVITGPFGPPGSEETEFPVNPIPRHTYMLPGDPKPPEGSKQKDFLDANYIIREIAGLGDGSKRQHPYTLETLGDAFAEHFWSDHDWEGNPRGQLDLNPPYLEGKAAEEAGSIYRMVYQGNSAIWEWAVDLLKSQYGYSDQDILDQMNAGWAYYNYTAEELAGAGRGPEVPTSPITTPSEPGTLGNGDNQFGSDGNQSGKAMEWANLVPDFRGEVAIGPDKLPLAGERPSWWIDYLPLDISPNSIYIATQNAILPFLSKANQKRIGFDLALGVGGELDRYLDLPGSLYYGEESHEELVWGPGAAPRWQNLKQTINNLRDYLKDRLTGTVAATNLMQLDWLFQSVERLQIMTASGKPGQTRLDSYKDEIYGMMAKAEATNNPEALKENWATGYGELLTMILEPYVPYLDSAWADIHTKGGRQEYGGSGS